MTDWLHGAIVNIPQTVHEVTVISRITGDSAEYSFILIGEGQRDTFQVFVPIKRRRNGYSFQMIDSPEWATVKAWSRILDDPRTWRCVKDEEYFGVRHYYRDPEYVVVTIDND